MACFLRGEIHGLNTSGVHTKSAHPDFSAIVRESSLFRVGLSVRYYVSNAYISNCPIRTYTACTLCWVVRCGVFETR